MYPSPASLSLYTEEGFSVTLSHMFTASFVASITALSAVFLPNPSSSSLLLDYQHLQNAAWKRQGLLDFVVSVKVCKVFMTLWCRINTWGRKSAYFVTCLHQVIPRRGLRREKARAALAESWIQEELIQGTELWYQIETKVVYDHHRNIEGKRFETPRFEFLTYGIDNRAVSAFGTMRT